MRSCTMPFAILVYFEYLVRSDTFKHAIKRSTSVVRSSLRSYTSVGDCRNNYYEYSNVDIGGN